MNRIIFAILAIGILSLGACSESSEQKKINSELRLFKSNAVVLPGNLQPWRSEEQSPDTTLLSRSLKMIVYVNPEGCTDCKLRALLPVYMFILENEHRENFGVVIILNTPEIDAANFLLTDMRFRRTVFYDVDGSFERLNPHLPANEQFHTFLINQENKIVLAGNPAYNQKLKKLYLKEMNKQ
jgi:hypothetical protein